jgi:hypothetical protein
MLDFYALRAQQYGWFLQFVHDWDKKKNLTQLPNMAYSVALAQFHHSKSKTTNNEEMAERADEMLQKALIEFPGMLLPLLDKCSVDIDKRVYASQFFLDAQSK